MRRYLWLSLFAALLLFIFVPAQAEQVTTDGVIYELAGDFAVITGFEEGRTSVSVHAEIQGFPTYAHEEFHALGNALEEIIFTDGVTNLAPYYALLSNVQRISLPASYAFESEQGSDYFGKGFLAFAPYLEVLHLPAEITEKGLDSILFCATWQYRDSQDDIRNAHGPYSDPVDPLANRNFHSIKIASTHPTLYDIDGIVYEKGTGRLLACLPGRAGAIVVPEGTTGIADGAFLFCDRVETVSLPRSLTSIGARAFAYCGSLRTVWLPPTLETIGEGAFFGCISLPSIVVPDGVTIKAGAFDYCASLLAVYLLGDQSIVDPRAFAKCPLTLTIYAKENSSGWAAAAASDSFWAEPGGVPVKLHNPNRLHKRPAYIHANDAESLVPLSAEPFHTAEPLMELAVGDTVDVLETLGDWVRISLYNATGFVPLDNLLLFPQDEPYQRLTIIYGVPPFTLYDAPSLEARATEGVKNHPYPLIEQFGSWYRVDDNGMSRYIRVAEGTPCGIILSGPVMRVVLRGDRKQALIYAGPTEESEVIGVAYEGMQVSMCGCDKGYDSELPHILFNGVEAYISSKLALIYDEESPD